MILYKKDEMSIIEKRWAYFNTARIVERRYKYYLDKIQKLRLMDDVFFNKCMEGSAECAELILYIIMNRIDLKVISVQIQHLVKTL